MSLFDRFRRKGASSPDPQPANDDLDEPRCGHYTFAHYALRSVAHQNPMECLAILASPRARAFLSDLLRSVAEHCRARGKESDLAVDDIIVHPVRAAGNPCAVVEMTRPRAVAEAHFVAAVLLVGADPGSPGEGQPSVRYFTLEKGMSFEGPPRTVLCEWTAEGSHVNYGDGPEPGVDAFVQAVAALVASKPAS
jgi:hypothetical protein